MLWHFWPLGLLNWETCGSPFDYICIPACCLGQIMQYYAVSKPAGQTEKNTRGNSEGEKNKLFGFKPLGVSTFTEHVVPTFANSVPTSPART